MLFFAVVFFYFFPAGRLRKADGKIASAAGNQAAKQIVI